MTPSLLDFLRAGGVVDWRLWNDLDEEGRGLLVEAQQELEAERAGLIASILLETWSDAVATATIKRDLSAAADMLAENLKESPA